MRSVSMPQSARATFKLARLITGRSEGHQVSMPQSARATFKQAPPSAQPEALRVSMPQSARATVKRETRTPPPRWDKGFNASIGTSNLQANAWIIRCKRAGCFNASIGTSNLQAQRFADYESAIRGFNASIGTSNLQAWPSALAFAGALSVSMPQSARATFKPVVHLMFLLYVCVSMPQSARATFKPDPKRAGVRAPGCFNASIGTSNLQANHRRRKCWRRRRFQCLNRHEQPSSQHSLCVHLSVLSGFNASIGTSNLQAIRQSTMPGRWSLFQCLNRHEQPSSPLKAVGMAPTT